MLSSALEVLSIDDAIGDPYGTQRIAQNDEDSPELFSELSEELRNIRESSKEIHSRNRVLSSLFCISQRLVSSQDSYKSPTEHPNNQYLQLFDNVIDLTKDCVRRFSESGTMLYP
jgi:hypothetical protein